MLELAGGVPRANEARTAYEPSQTQTDTHTQSHSFDIALFILSILDR